MEGDGDGFRDGNCDGCLERVGDGDGSRDGRAVGDRLGVFEGREEGLDEEDGWEDGVSHST